MTGVVTEQVFRLYRIFADDGALLYIGESNDTLRRFVEHLKAKRWAAEVADHRRDRRVFYSKAEVQAAERDAVERERPRFNVEYNQGNPDRVDPETMRFPDGRLYRPEVYHQSGAVGAPVRHARAAAKPPRPPKAPQPSPSRSRRRRRASSVRPLGLVLLWLVLAVAFWWAAGRHGGLHGWQGPKVGARNASFLLAGAWLFSALRRRRR